MFNVRHHTQHGSAPRRSWRHDWRGLLAATVTLGALVFSAGIAAPATPTNDPTTDPYSMAAVTTQTGATAWWNAGYTGAGIDVAVIDTGVSPVEGLAQPGKIVYGPDLSFDSQASNLTNLDGFGHGTFMAGLIAGHDTALTAPYASAPATQYRGIAPDARIVSVKAGASDGGVDVTQVIAAIDWVVQHRNDPGMNIRVLSLSYGTNSLQSYTVDPLAHAVENAWRKGIVVVASAGNTGYQRGNGAPGLASPAYNPFVIGVGGYDTNGTAIPNDDYMGSYSASSSGCGSLCKNPDFVAMGSHVEGLRVPGSYIDVNHPEGVVTSRFFRGSGTSQSAAITAGAAALILQKYPTLTPDAVKKFITTNAKKVPAADSQAQGAGELDLAALATKAPVAYTQKFTASTGAGSLDVARGTDRVADNGVSITGSVDIFGQPLDAAALAAAEDNGTAWIGGNWNGRTWSGAGWNGRTWSGAVWTGNSWSGRTWSGRTWSSAIWDGRTWSGRTWSGSGWSSGTWSGHVWADGSWS
jgi:serine protease AprX